MGVNQKEKMIRMMGIDVRDPLTHVKGTKNRRIVACTAIKKITFVLIALKLWRSEIAKRYWPKSNYVSIAQATITEQTAEEEAAVTTVNGNATHQFVIAVDQTVGDLWLHKTRDWSKSRAVHFQILGRAVHILRLLSWIILEFNVLRWCLGPLARSLESMAWPLAV